MKTGLGTFKSATLLLSLLVSGCGSLPDRSGFFTPGDSAPDHPRIDIAAIPDAVPRVEPKSKYGNPPSYVVRGKRYYVLEDSKNYRARGIASWYGTKFHGKKTSSGEHYDMFAMTAAHRTLPLPTYIEVTNLANQRKVIVKVNDRGPFSDDRILDLSYAAATKLDITANGTALIEIRAIDPRQYHSRHQPQAADGAQARRSSGKTNNISAATTRQASTPVYLQVAAFKERHNAERLRHQLVELASTEVHIEQSPRDATNTIYRVITGPISNAEEAGRLAEKITVLGLGKPHLIQQ